MKIALVVFGLIAGLNAFGMSIIDAKGRFDDLGVVGLIGLTVATMCAICLLQWSAFFFLGA